jgi:GNAT superfamily N-acetyltransferase
MNQHISNIGHLDGSGVEFSLREGEMMAPKPADIAIREFQPGDEAAWRQLNEEWIVHYFGPLEPKDEEALNDPGAILARGGRIFFAERDGRALGCCGLVAGDHGFEVAKMAVTAAARGGGIGRRLLENVIAAAREMGIVRLFLETNRKLTPAITLYESVGFRHLPPERFVHSPYARSNVQMELEL